MSSNSHDPYKWVIGTKIKMQIGGNHGNYDNLATNKTRNSGVSYKKLAERMCILIDNNNIWYLDFDKNEPMGDITLKMAEIFGGTKNHNIAVVDYRNLDKYMYNHMCEKYHETSDNAFNNNELSDKYFEIIGNIAYNRA